jgi:hypothetical protein
MEGVGDILKPLEMLYWLRLALGVIAALLCIGYGVATGSIPHNPSGGSFPGNLTYFMDGLMIALAFYLISYYAVKPKFVSSVAKPQKLVTTGIGIYFFGWIVFWVIFYVIIAGPPV